jgi:triacylglycerol lipase
MRMHNKMNLKYPVVMVHGVGFHDKVLVFNYWGRIASSIENMGIDVYYGDNDAWGTINDSAIRIKNTIDEVLHKTNAEKVNLIAHSRGGLDCRYLISSLKYSNKVASLTTISTPHRGSKSLNILHVLPEWLIKIIGFFANISLKIIGDKNPKFGIACKELSEISCERFNTENQNVPNVYYQSFGSKMESPFNDLMFLTMNVLIKILDDENDGIVSFNSMKWDNFRAMNPENTKKGLSHADVVDLRRQDRFNFDICDFYKNVILELGEKGF